MKKINLFLPLILVSMFFLSSCLEELIECPDTSFTMEEVDNSDREENSGKIDQGNAKTYKFTANLSGITDGRVAWYIDGQLQQDANEAVFFFQFTPGTYTICLEVQTPECDQVLEFCAELEVSDDHPSDKCEDVAFEAIEGDHEGYYKFVSNVENENAVFYWYVNEKLVGDTTKNYLEYDLAEEEGAGVHEVCLKVATPECDELSIYCEEIEVHEFATCPELRFEKERDGDSYAYYFYAAFEGKEEIRYGWYINDDLVEEENVPGKDSDHKLYWQFSPNEVYTVCIKAESPNCPENGVVVYCEEIKIETPACPDMFFKVVETDSPRNFKFIADFEGMNDLEWYGWFINGELVEDEGSMNQGDNILEYTFTEGTYEICIMTETPDCPQGTSYCKTIEVVFETEPSCPELFFEAEKEPNAPAYTFYADFPSMDDITYSWEVYENNDYLGGKTRSADSNDEHNFYWQFGAGTYKVCLQAETPECPDGVSYCSEVTIE